MKKGVLLAAVSMALLSVACSSTAKKSGVAMDGQERSIYEDALKSFEAKAFDQSLVKFNAFLSRYPTSAYYVGALYNSGLSLENLSRYEEALGKYRAVVDYFQGNHTKDEAEALYRISICQEILGNDTQTLLTLLDLEKHQGVLAKETLEVEVPARLASAYARLGNEDQAHMYYERASAGLKRLRRQSLTGDLPVWLPKTLYHMGRVSLGKRNFPADQYKNFLLALDNAQGWLLRAAETGNNEWAQKGAQELVTAYQQALDLIEKVPLADDPDRLAALKQQQTQQRSMSADLSTVAGHLKLERLPRSESGLEPVHVTEIFNSVAGVEKRALGYLNARDVQDQTTSEAQSREGLKGEGRIIEPAPSPLPKKKTKSKSLSEKSLSR